MELHKLILLSVFLIPGVPAGLGYGYEQVKVIAFILLTTISGLIWWLKYRKKNIKLIQIQVFSLLFILVLLLSSLFGIQIENSFLGSEPYYQGWLTYLYLLLFSLLVSWSHISRQRWISIITLSSLVVAVVAIIQWLGLNSLGWSLPTYGGRIVSTFGQPNFFAGFILLTLPLVAVIFRSGSGLIRLIGYLNLIVGSLAIVTSGSKATIALLLSFLIVWWLMRLPKLASIAAAFMLGGLVTLVILVNLATPGFIYQEIFQPYQQLRLVSGTAEKRVYIWEVMAQLVERKPYLGYGLESIGRSYQNYFQSLNYNTLNNPPYLTLRDLRVDRSHSYLLDLVLFSGIVGLLGYLGLVGWVLFKIKSPPLLVSLLIYLIWTQLHNQSLVHLIFFWWMVGIINRSETIDS